jgi:cytochrome c oxidase cbb3-type subunit 3
MNRVRALIALVLIAVVLAAACSNEDTPALSGDQADDAALLTGQRVYDDNCARCHGNAGGGGAGPKLSDGEVVKDFPDPEDQAEVIRKGRGAMPAWENKLTSEEIDAVVRYTREVL